MGLSVITYPAISSLTTDPAALQQSINQLKESVELLTGQAGIPTHSFPEGMFQVQKRVGGVSAQMFELNEIQVAANEALAQRTFVIEAEIEDARDGMPNLHAKITQVDTARVQGDQALAQSVSTLSTTVGQNTAQLTILNNSVNGIAVNYSVIGNINGQTGGFVFTGVRRLDGGVTYNMEFYSNVIINGDLMVTGSINNRTITDGAATRLASTYVKTSGTATCVANFRQNAMAKIEVMLSEMEGTTRYVPPGGGSLNPQVRAWDVFFDGTKIGVVTSIESCIGYTKAGADYLLYFACTPVMRSYGWGPVSAGNHTIEVVNTSGNSVGCTIFVIEHAK